MVELVVVVEVVVTLFIIRIMDARTRRNIHNYTVVARSTVMVIGRTPPPALLCACVRSNAHRVVWMGSFSKQVPRTFLDFRWKCYALVEYPSRHLWIHFNKIFSLKNSMHYKSKLQSTSQLTGGSRTAIRSTLRDRPR